MSKFGFQIFQSILVTLIVLFWIRRGLTYIIYANLISNHGTLEKHLSLSFYTIFLVCFDLSSVSQTLSLPPTDLLSLCWKSQLKSTCFVLTFDQYSVATWNWKWKGPKCFVKKSRENADGRLLLFNKIQRMKVV